MATKNPVVVTTGQLQAIQSMDVANIGYPVMGWKNRLINGNMEFWQRATSFSNPGNGTYSGDRWVVSFDGTGGTTVYSQLALAPGEIPTLEDVRFAYRHNCTSARTGATLNRVLQRVEGVRQLAGRTVTFSFWAKADIARDVAVSASQIFGTGGTPSADVDFLALTTIPIMTSWARYSHTIAVPSINGKTLGTTNDFSTWRIHFPLNTTYTIDFTGVQLEISPTVTDFEIRSLTVEEELARRYCQALTTDAFGTCTSTTAVHALVPLRPLMRTTPTGVLSTTTPVISRPLVGDATGSGSTLVVGGASTNHLVSLEIDGFTALTRPDVMFLKTGQITLDAEL